jgi:hypothetical protein
MSAAPNQEFLKIFAQDRTLTNEIAERTTRRMAPANLRSVKKIITRHRTSADPNGEKIDEPRHSRRGTSTHHTQPP